MSVRLSVTLMDCDDIGLNSSKIISRLVSLGCSLSGVSAHPNISTPRGTPRNFCARMGVWGAEKVILAHKSFNISETWQDRTKVTFVTNEDE